VEVEEAPCRCVGLCDEKYVDVIGSTLILCVKTFTSKQRKSCAARRNNVILSRERLANRCFEKENAPMHHLQERN